MSRLASRGPSPRPQGTPRTPRHARRPRPFRPLFELLEDRRLLSGTGFLRGTVLNDQTSVAQAGATVTLFASDGTTQLAQQTTGADGKYNFTSLDPGTYFIKETPPAGFVNDSTHISSPLDPGA